MGTLTYSQVGINQLGSFSIVSLISKEYAQDKILVVDDYSHSLF